MEEKKNTKKVDEKATAKKKNNKKKKKKTSLAVRIMAITMALLMLLSSLAGILAYF